MSSVNAQTFGDGGESSDCDSIGEVAMKYEYLMPIREEGQETKDK